MARAKTYSLAESIPEIPFDVADWGDVPDPWPGGLFRTDEEFEQAKLAAEDLPIRPPQPK